MNEWVWCIGGMILTGETEVLGEKHYTASVVDEWIWNIGAMLLTGETEVLGEKHYTALVIDEWMSMEHWWNGTDRGNWSAGWKTLYSFGGSWMNMEHWWNVTDRGNWSTGRKTLYSVDVRWMNAYGALVEWYWQGKLKCWEKNITSIQRRWLMNEWVGNIGGMILTGENWSTGR